MALCQCCRLLISQRLILLRKGGKRRAHPHRGHSQTSLCMSCISGTSRLQTAQSRSTCRASTLLLAWYAILCCFEDCRQGLKQLAGLPMGLQAVQPAGQLLYAQLPYFIHQPRLGVQDHASWETACMAEEVPTCRTRQQELSICGISNKRACHTSTCCRAMILAQSQSNRKISKFPRCKNDLSEDFTTPADILHASIHLLPCV